MQGLSDSRACHLPLGLAGSLVQSTLCPGARFLTMGSIHFSKLPLSIFWKSKCLILMFAPLLPFQIYLFIIFSDQISLTPPLKLDPLLMPVYPVPLHLTCRRITYLMHYIVMLFICLCLSFPTRCQLHQGRYFSLFWLSWYVTEQALIVSWIIKTVDAWMGTWVDRWMDGWMDGWVGRWMDGWTNEWKLLSVDGQTDEWMDESMYVCMYVWTNEWMGECVDG